MGGREYFCKVSRLHFELVPAKGQPQGHFIITNFGSNPITVQQRILHQKDGCIARVGERVDFVTTTEDGLEVQVVYLHFRLREMIVEANVAGVKSWRQPGQTSEVLPQCSSPAMLGPRQQLLPSCALMDVPATHELVCVEALGCDIYSLEPARRCIPLWEDIVNPIGRQHQIGFFEALLEASGFINHVARNHLELKPPRQHQDGLEVVAVSSNPVLLGGRPLAGGSGAIVEPGDRLNFVAAKADGSEGCVVYLQLCLRKTGQDLLGTSPSSASPVAGQPIQQPAEVKKPQRRQRGWACA